MKNKKDRVNKVGKKRKRAVYISNGMTVAVE